MYYCDLVRIHTIMTQTVDLKPRCTNEIFTISHSHSEVSRLPVKSDSQDNSPPAIFIARISLVSSLVEVT